MPRLELTFEIDQDGLLSITGFETHFANSLTIQLQRPHLEPKDRQEFLKKYGRCALGEAPWAVKRLLWVAKMKEGIYCPFFQLPHEIIREIIKNL